MKHPPPSNAGFALPELLISLVLTGILLGGLYQGYLWLQRAWIDWNRQYTLHTDVHRILTQWVRDVTYAEQWIPEADTAWTLVGASGRRVRYVLRDSVLHRQGRPLHHGAVQIPRFQVQAVPDAGAQGMRRGMLIQAQCDARAWQYTTHHAVETLMRPGPPWPDPP